MRVKVKMMLCMEVNGKRYKEPKTAALAVARAIAYSLQSRWMCKHYDEYGRPTGDENYYSYHKRITKKVYRRVKARIWKAFGEYVIA